MKSKSKNLFDHYKEPICKIWFDEKGYMTATEIGFELIRCKDCEGYEEGRCHWWYDEPEVPEDGYCHQAERKSQ